MRSSYKRFLTSLYKVETLPFLWVSMYYIQKFRRHTEYVPNVWKKQNSVDECSNFIVTIIFTAVVAIGFKRRGRPPQPCDIAQT